MVSVGLESPVLPLSVHPKVQWDTEGSLTMGIFHIETLVNLGPEPPADQALTLDPQYRMLCNWSCLEMQVYGCNEAMEDMAFESFLGVACSEASVPCAFPFRVKTTTTTTTSTTRTASTTPPPPPTKPNSSCQRAYRLSPLKVTGQMSFSLSTTVLSSIAWHQLLSHRGDPLLGTQFTCFAPRAGEGGAHSSAAYAATRQGRGTRTSSNTWEKRKRNFSFQPYLDFITKGWSNSSGSSHHRKWKPESSHFLSTLP